MSAARLIPGAIEISNASEVKMSVSPDFIAPFETHLQKRLRVIEL
jgi:hypothetical protein